MKNTHRTRIMGLPSAAANTIAASRSRAAAAADGHHPHGTGLSRRTVITAFGATLLAAPLAACSTFGASAKQNASAASAAAVGKDAQRVVDDIAAKISEHWPYMNMVWPGMDYTRHILVLLKIDDQLEPQAAWAIDTQGTRVLEPAEYADLPVPAAMSYEKLTFDDRPSLIMSFDDMTTADADQLDFQISELYLTATHELVHFYYQDEDIKAEGQADGPSNSRTTDYPLDPKPRIVRKMIHHRLAQAYTDPSQRSTHLAHAKYWNDMWESTYGEDANKIRVTDIVEGTARYCENLGDIVTADLSEDESRKLRTELIGEDDFIPKSAEVESYELGYVAGIVLDEINPSWKDGFYGTGKTLVGLALDGVTAEDDEEDPAIRDVVNQKITSLNEEAADDIRALDEAEADTSIPYLRLALGMGGGFSFSRSTSYHYKGKEVMLKVEIAPSAGEGVHIQDATGFIPDNDDGQYFTFPMEKGAYSFDNETLTLSGKKFTGSTKADRTTEGGREIFTVK